MSRLEHGEQSNKYVFLARLCMYVYPSVRPSVRVVRTIDTTAVLSARCLLFESHVVCVYHITGDPDVLFACYILHMRKRTPGCTVVLKLCLAQKAPIGLRAAEVRYY